MSFNLKRYLTENNLTIISKIREEEEGDIEPSQTDLKQSEKDFRNLDKDRKELERLRKIVKKFLGKYTKRDAKGKLTITDTAAYKKAVGQIPYDIQRLKAKIEKIENPKLDSDEENN